MHSASYQHPHLFFGLRLLANLPFLVTILLITISMKTSAARAASTATWASSTKINAELGALFDDESLDPVPTRVGDEGTHDSVGSKRYAVTRHPQMLAADRSTNSVQVSMEDIRESLIGSSQICRRVCSFCHRVTSKSVAALCQTHCMTGGRAFMACLTFWTIRHDLL